MRGPVKAYLYGNLDHDTAKHEGRVGGCTVCREWPGTQQTESFDDMINLWYIRQGAPYKPGNWPRKSDQEGGIGVISTGSNTNDCPKQKLRRGPVLIRSSSWIQEGKIWVVVREESVNGVRDCRCESDQTKPSRTVGTARLPCLVPLPRPR